MMFVVWQSYEVVGEEAHVSLTDLGLLLYPLALEEEEEAGVVVYQEAEED